MDIEVDTAALLAAAGRMRRGAEQIGAALAEIPDGTAGGLGTPVLDEACRAFQARWRTATSSLHGRIEHTGTELDGTAAGYEAVDDELAGKFAALVPGGGGA